MSSINEIFRTFGPEYLRRFGQDMPAQHRKVMADICACRTEAFGTVVHRCPDCDYRQLVHRACGNRHCPGCQQHKGQQWLDRPLASHQPGFLSSGPSPGQVGARQIPRPD